MRLPQKKKPGDPVLAADWNVLLDAIAARTPRPGTGLEMIASSGGFAYSHPAPLSALHAGLPPFSVIGIEKTDGSYLVTIKEGWVIERKPRLGDTPTVRFHIPKAGDQTLDSIPRPQIVMAIGDTLWCKFTTDKMGEINSEPEVFAASEDQTGGHYYPNDPEGPGSDGGYFVKLFKLEQEEGSPVVRVYQQSDIEHWAQLWTGVNVGYGSGVYKKHDEGENIYKFRSLKGVDGTTVTEKEDEIEISGGSTHPWKVTNNGDSTARVQGGTLYDTLSKKTGGGTGEYWDFVMQPFDKATEASVEVTGTGYIYVQVEIALSIGDDGRTLYNNPVVYGIPSFDGMPSCQFHFYGDQPAITVFFSTTTPGAIGSGPSEPPLWIIPIAKVSLDGSNVVVDSQYLTHNPMLQLAMTHLNAP